MADIQFWRSKQFSDTSFLDLVKRIFGKTFTKGSDAKDWLISNGYYTSYPDIVTDGLILNLDAGNSDSFKGEPTTNLAPYNDYSNRVYNYVYEAASWGGDYATCIYYSSGGYNNLPYKKMIKTSGGSGGSFMDDNLYFTINNNTTYTISCYMKANRNVNVGSLALCINRSSDNTYRYTPDVILTTEWVRYSWTYNAGSDHYGTSYISRHIIYVDDNLPLEVYWSGFQVEEKDHITPFVNGTRGTTYATGGGWCDLSGNGNHGELINGPTYNSDNLGSVVFDGSYDYVKTNLDLSWNNTNSVSIVMAVKTSSLSQTNSPFIGKINDDWEWTMYQNNQELHLTYWDSSGGHTNSMDWTINSFFTSTNDFIFFQYIWNGTKSLLYKNNTLVLDFTATNPSINKNNNLGIVIGGHIYTWSDRYWNGKVSLVQIYNKALTASEVTQNFNTYKDRFGL